jgi:hypothetical protein
MAVPARPVAGAVVESAWGQIAHDTAVAQDVQTGIVTVSLSAANQGSTVMTFPRPFAAAPVCVAIIVSTAGAALGLIVQLNVISATGATIRLSTASGSAATIANVPVHWIAYGPRV